MQLYGKDTGRLGRARGGRWRRVEAEVVVVVGGLSSVKCSKSSLQPVLATFS